VTYEVALARFRDDIGRKKNAKPCFSLLALEPGEA